MSIGVLDGSEGYPDRFGPDRGVREFIPDKPDSLDVYKPGLTAERLRRTLPVSNAMIYLTQSLSE